MRVRIGKSKKEITCAHTVRTDWDDGIDIELFEVEGIDGKNRTILLPEHTKLVRMFNDHGKEIDRVEWKEEREMEGFIDGSRL